LIFLFDLLEINSEEEVEEYEEGEEEQGHLEYV
jgi:hypothetical protein